MAWQFTVKLNSMSVLPLKEFGYLATIEHWWTSEPLNPSLSSLLRNADKSLEITTAEAAADQLRNQSDRGLALLKGSEPEEISFLTYWHDPTGKDPHLFGATIGLSSQDLDSIRSDFGNAFFSGCTLTVTASGGFSTVDPNPHSTQPTQEKFETGFPLQLFDIRVGIEASRPSDVSSGEALEG